MIKGVTRHISGIPNLFTLNVCCIFHTTKMCFSDLCWFIWDCETIFRSDAYMQKKRLNVYDKAYPIAIATSGIKYIRLKIKPNSVRIISLSWQFSVLPLTGFELTPLIHCSPNRLALCPAPSTTWSHPLY